MNPRVVLRLVGVAAIVTSAGCGGGTPLQQYERSAKRASPTLERSTGKKFTGTPKLEERTREELRGFLENAFNEQMPPLELAGIEASYKRFGLLPDTLDVRAFLLRLLDEQVAGYYDPKTKTLYIMKDLAPALVNITITHELVHALQDQNFPLDSLERIRSSNDRRTAAQAIAEGQATWEQLVVMTGIPNPANAMPGGWEAVRNLIREQQTNMPVLNYAPTLLKEQLLFPYLSGAEHIRQFKTRRADAWPFDSLPESTEQILHAEKYFGERDHPTTVTLPELRGGAKSVYESDLGEFETRIYLYENTHDINRSVSAAAGWDGDRYMLVNLGGKEAMLWATVWDSPVDAAEFIGLLDTALPIRYPGLKKQGTGGEIRRFSGGGRSVEIRGVTVDGRPVVLLTDVPAGASLDLVDPARIRLTQ